MSRAAAALALVALSACAVPRDVYAGSDFPDAGEAPEDVSPPERDASSAPVPPPPDAEPIEASAPAPPVCAITQADCDGQASNGCEVELATNPQHCGRCGNACRSPDCACRGGQLVVVCPAGRADCDGDTRNGCEIDVSTSMQHCGACGRACHTMGHDAIAAVCVAGKCNITCQIEAFPEGDCDGNPDNGCETPLWNNNDNCGACGVRCTCANGVCL